MENASNQEKVLTLWIVTASSSNKREPLHNSPDFITAIYACDRADAEKKAQLWLAQHPERPYHFFEERAQGFLMGTWLWLPGYLIE